MKRFRITGISAVVAIAAAASMLTPAHAQSTESADLAVSITGPEMAKVGTRITYEIEVFQDGPASASGATIVNRLDDTLELVSFDASQGSCTENGQRIHCDLGEMAAGDSASLTVVADSTKEGTVSDRADVDSEAYDEDPGDNVAVLKTEIGDPKVETKKYRPSDDATVYKATPNLTKAHDYAVGTDKRSEKRALLRFEVDGVGGKKILKAVLRLYNLDRSPSGGRVHGMTDTAWDEDSVNWNNAPGYLSGVAGSLHAVEEGKWYRVDVTEQVLGDGAVSFTITSKSTDGAWYASRDYQKKFAPRLVLSLIDKK